VVRHAAVSSSSCGTSETMLDSLRLPTLPIASTVDRADALDERTGDNHDTQPSFAPNVSPVPAGILAKEPSVAVNCCLTWLDLVTCD
jgi:hypothetical protein